MTGRKAGGDGDIHRKQVGKMHTKTYYKKNLNESKGKNELGEKCSTLGLLSDIQ